jgi:hypothetical protein
VEDDDVRGFVMSTDLRIESALKAYINVQVLLDRFR